MGKHYRSVLGRALLLLGLCVNASSAANDDLPILFGGSFSLLDQHGEVRTDKDFHGKFLLLFFGYTYCPDICPTNLATIAKTMTLLGTRAERVQPLFISLDPARDTPEVLGEYVRYFDPRIIALSGAEEQLRPVLQAYRILSTRVQPKWSDNAADYLINHSTITYLMGPDGEFLTLFPHATRAPLMADAIDKYLR